jgi:hypothetical protein
VTITNINRPTGSCISTHSGPTTAPLSGRITSSQECTCQLTSIHDKPAKHPEHHHRLHKSTVAPTRS